MKVVGVNNEKQWLTECVCLGKPEAGVQEEAQAVVYTDRRVNTSKKSKGMARGNQSGDEHG